MSRQTAGFTSQILDLLPGFEPWVTFLPNGKDFEEVATSCKGDWIEVTLVSLPQG
jgi:hypothetical protein